MRSSDKLKLFNVYTRKELQEIFEIVDETIRTGVFRPKGHESIWLFVTGHKSPDRTQYVDYLDGETLCWEGQTMGRTDKSIIEHKKQALEVLLFYRKEKGEFEGAGFKYEGQFEYVSHENKRPTRFILRRVRPKRGAK